MFSKTIHLLESNIRANIQLINDPTGVVTQYSKEQSRIWVDELELAIAALKHCGSPSEQFGPDTTQPTPSEYMEWTHSNGIDTDSAIKCYTYLTRKQKQ